MKEITNELYYKKNETILNDFYSKIKKSCIFLFLFFSLTISLYSTEFITNFEELMDMNAFYAQKFFSKKDLEEIDFFKSIYNKNIRNLLDDGIDINTIPKVIHFVWIGPKDFPKNSIKNLESWVKYHPGWKIKFWTDRERPGLIPGLEKHLISEIKMDYLGDFLEKTTNYGEKSDLIRYEILYSEGGVYVDHDIECYQSFERLTNRFDFYASLEPPHYNPGYDYAIFPTNALVGCCPKHPIIKKTMQNVCDSWYEVEKKYPGKINTFVRVLNRTFVPFTNGVKSEIINDFSKNIILPSSFLYDHKETSREIAKKRIDNYCSLANHTYDGVWTK